MTQENTYRHIRTYEKRKPGRTLCGAEMTSRDRSFSEAKNSVRVQGRVGLLQFDCERCRHLMSQELSK